MTCNYIYSLKYMPVYKLIKIISFWKENTDSFGNIKDWNKHICIICKPTIILMINDILKILRYPNYSHFYD